MKRCSLSEAVERYVSNGDTVVLGAALEQAIPFAAGHQLIRQGLKDLTLVGPISDILFDQLIGAGCVRRVEAAWVGNVAGGSAYNFRRAMESGTIEMHDHSNLTLALRLQAAAWGVPFLPTRTALGSDLLENPALRPLRCPFSDTALVAVKALKPDVTIVHAPYADVQGNAHWYGNLGVTCEAVGASRRVILTVEEIVPEATIRARPELVRFPGVKVDAVVEVPFGAHPAPLVTCYQRDDAYFLNYHAQSKVPEDFQRWLADWVLGVRRQAYLEQIDTEGLRV